MLVNPIEEAQQDIMEEKSNDWRSSRVQKSLQIENQKLLSKEEGEDILYGPEGSNNREVTKDKVIADNK